MKDVKLKTIEQSDNVCLYSICFDGSEESEFERFLAAFKDNGKYKTLALSCWHWRRLLQKGHWNVCFALRAR